MVGADKCRWVTTRCGNTTFAAGPNKAEVDVRVLRADHCAQFCTIWPLAKTVPFSAARTHLTELLDEIEQIHEHVVITRNGRPAAVVMSQAEYESLIQTLEVLSDKDLMAALAESQEDVAAGRVTPWEEVKRELGLA